MSQIWSEWFGAETKKVEKEEYNNFYKDRFYDYEDPMHIIHVSAPSIIKKTSMSSREDSPCKSSII